MKSPKQVGICHQVCGSGRATLWSAAVGQGSLATLGLKKVCRDVYIHFYRSMGSHHMRVCVLFPATDMPRRGFWEQAWEGLGNTCPVSCAAPH